MALERAQQPSGTSGWRTLDALVAAEGSGSTGCPARLAEPHAPLRDVADAIHALAMLHGRHPGAIAIARAGGALAEAEPWLEMAENGFAAERLFLVQLTAAAGPLPSTPGQAESEATVVAQSHALDTLAGSGRAGCGLGSAVALVRDWAAIRAFLDAAADRLAIDVPPKALPTARESAQLLAGIGAGPAIDRALVFGAQQVLAQHRGLWNLLEARAGARDRL